MPAGFRFCGRCGVELPLPETPTAAVVDDERKVVSVVFADLEASTELASRLDPEDLHAVYRSYFEAMSQEVLRHGGTVEKFIGDAVVGVFGAPIAHEDDPVRAVRAALAMQSKLPELNDRVAPSTGGSLGLRAAVHTGEVLAGSGTDLEGSVTGDTTNIAARLQGVAPPGGVVVSQRTQRDTRRAFDFKLLGEMELKGVPEPVITWQVLRETGTESSSEFASPFVGRRDELDIMALLLRRCSSERRPYVATVVGPAGMGKSRLVHEFAHRVSNDDETPHAHIVRGRCLPYGDGLHLWPLAQILRDDVGILESDPSGAIEAKARDLLEPRFADDDTGPSVVTILLSSMEIPVSVDPLAGVGREAAERMIADAWARYLAAAGAGVPLVVVIEDIHWAEDSLLDLLDRLADLTFGPVLFVYLARPEFLERRPSWGSGSANFTALELLSMPVDEGSALVQHLLDGAASPELLSTIVARAGGNPFFAAELVMMLREDRSIERRDGLWMAVGDVTATLPDTVQGAIAARIDRLSRQHKRALQDASVVGRVFWEGALPALGTPDPTSAVDELISRGLVRRRPTSSMASSRELVFEHALIQDVAYGSIPPSRRPEAHAAVVSWIEDNTSGRDEELAELLAHHASLAEDADRTRRYSTLAGHRHRRVFAAADAIRWYDRALAATERLPRSGTTLLVAEITLGRGEAFEQLGRFDEAHEDYERVLSTARSTGRPWLEAQTLATLAHLFWSQDRFDEAESLLPRGVEAARKAGIPNVEAQLAYTAGASAWSRGDPVLARSHHEEALRIAEEARDLEGEAYARHGLTQTLTLLGPLQEAMAQGERSRELWRTLGHRPMLHQSGQLLGTLHVLSGRPDVSSQLLDEVLQGFRDLGQRRFEPAALATRSLAQMFRGDLGSALACTDEALDLSRVVGSARGTFVSLVFRMLVHAELTMSSSARRDLPLAVALGDDAADFLHPVLAAARGWLQLESGDREQAVASFAGARQEAGTHLLPRYLAGRFEVRAWEAAQDGAALADSAARLMEVARGSSPPFEALGVWGQGRADQLAGGSFVAGARSALSLAEAAGDRTILWRAFALAADAADAEGSADEAVHLRQEAASVVRSIAASLPEGPVRAAFLARADVALLMPESESPR